jgi:ABC-type transport system substrate-binding protein
MTCRARPELFRPRGVSVGASALLGAVALSLAACNDAPSGRPSERLFTVGIYDTATTLGPIPGYTNDDLVIAGLPFEGLTRVDDQGRVVPALAESWQSADARSWDFRLRADARFHDGTLVHPDDVVRSWRHQLRSPRWQPRGTLQQLIVGAEQVVRDSNAPWPGLTVVDSRTLRVQLVEPNAEFPLAAATPPGWVFASTTTADRPVGTGPWQHARGRARDSTIMFARVTGRAPLFDSLRIRTIRSDESTGDLLGAGTIDWTIDLGTREYAELSTRRDLRLVSSRPLGLRRIGFSFRQPILRDIRVRRAVAHAIDRRALLSSRPGVPLEAAVDLLPQHLLPWPAENRTPFDPTRARALLRSAGYDSATMPLNLALWRSEVADSVREVAFFVRNYLVASGFNIRMVSVDDEAPIPGLLHHPNADLAVDIMHSVMPGIWQMVALSVSIAGRPTDATTQSDDAASRARTLPLMQRLRQATEPAGRTEVMREIAHVADSTTRTVLLWWQPELAGCSLRVSACPRSVIGNRFDSVFVQPTRERD